MLDDQNVSEALILLSTNGIRPKLSKTLLKNGHFPSKNYHFRPVIQVYLIK